MLLGISTPARGLIAVPGQPKGHRQLRCTFKAIVVVLAACSLSLILICALHPSVRQVRQGNEAKNPGHLSWRQKRRHAGSLFHETHDSSWSCPLWFERSSYEDIRDRYYVPYIFGGRQRPLCQNCHKDHLWAHFCQYESDGPVCTAWDRWRIIDTFIGRAELGAPGVEEMLTMTPCDLFRVLEGRTLWLVGDSQTQELMKAMQCFFSEFWDFDEEQKPVNFTNSLIARAALLKHPTSWCIKLLRGTRICHLRGNYGIDLAEDIFPFLPDIGALRSDFLVFNFGVWHNDLKSYAGNFSAVAEFLMQYQATMPFLIWREGSPQHFDTPQGEFGCEGCVEPKFPFVCKEIRNVFLDEHNRLRSSDPQQQIVLQGGWRNRIARPLMDHLKIPVLEIWNQSLPLWDYHHNYQNKQDCTHMCHPSAYQLWVAQFYILLCRIEPQLPKIA